MRALVQRVSEASVTSFRDDGSLAARGRIGPGLLILLGVGRGDDESAADRLAERCSRLRIFEDEQGKMNRSLQTVRGAALVVSQFTLYADTSRGLRPSFESAAEPDKAKPLYERFVAALKTAGVETTTGVFGARMKVQLVNEGPVTIMLDSADKASREGVETPRIGDTL
jgi:D-tyrosyl-tRNA(Tyr) deacylase